MCFFKRLREARLKANLTAKQVAEQLGVGNSTYSQYETGKREPDVNKIKKISSILNVSADYLVLGKTSSDLPIDDTYVELYKQLDIEDRAEIRGEMKHMLKAAKYNNKKTMSDEINEDLNKIANITLHTKSK